MNKRTGIPEIDQIMARSNDVGPVAQTGNPLVDSVMDALRGETPLGGADTGWLLIGGVKIGQTLIVKSLDGVPLLTVNVDPIPGVPLEEPNAVYPVLLKRGPEGDVQRVSVDFTRRMEYSNQPDQAAAILAKMEELGLAKHK